MEELNVSNIFDSHAHYDSEQFESDRFETIESVFKKGVVGIINASSDMQSNFVGLELSNKYDNMYFSTGIHPECVADLEENYLDVIRKLATENKKAVAIGEIGLDYYWDKTYMQKQKEVFEAQLILANELNMPVIIHCREATADTLSLLKKHKPKGVVHCFSGSGETAKEILKIGMYISFTGVLTFSNAKKALSALEVIPTDRLLLETDAPYMSPAPFRGKRCSSDLIAYTAAKMAKVKGLETQKMIDIATENTKRLFNIK